MDDVTVKLGTIFFPHATREAERLIASSESIDLVHYTSAESAMKILQTNKWWMRSTRCMNDHSEVDGGLRRLDNAMSSSGLGNELFGYLEECHAGLSPELGTKLQNTAVLSYGTFVASFSEHLAKEDRAGRLSMWRGYGGISTGVAMVIDKGIVTGDGRGLNVFASPVFYGSDDQLLELLTEVVHNIRDSRDFLKTVDRARLVHALYLMLAFAAISLKHHGFSEEREWRLVYLPAIVWSAALTEEVVTIGGTPQKVQSIPLVDRPDIGVHDVTIDVLLKKIIIGPSQFADTIGAAFARQLEAMKVTDPWGRITVSDIPLRV